MVTGDGKYVIFKEEAFQEWYGRVCTKLGVPNGLPETIDDGTVIRAQDVFAAPALFSYFNAIQTSIEILESMSIWDAEIAKSVMANNVHIRLQELAGFFHSRATAAQVAPFKKIPD